jgi:hypothetical protein
MERKYASQAGPYKARMRARCGSDRRFSPRVLETDSLNTSLDVPWPALDSCVNRSRVPRYHVSGEDLPRAADGRVLPNGQNLITLRMAQRLLRESRGGGRPKNEHPIE